MQNTTGNLIEQIITADALEGLSQLDNHTADTCITSPPYFNLRDYGVSGQIGLESTTEEYIARLVAVFREVRRVIRDDGTLWIVIGDSYAGSGKRGGGDPTVGERKIGDNGYPAKVTPSDCKKGDLIGIPWILAFALRSDGWYLRSDIIWHKPNPMPESVDSRPTKAHEYIFLLSKSSTYYYNHTAIMEPTVCTRLRDFTDSGRDKQRGHGRRHSGFNGRYTEKLAVEGVPTRKNKRSVWTVPTKPYPEAHFATFPPELIRPCVLAGCRPGGVIIDPFFGAGTTGLVALQEGRGYIGIDINPEYVALAEKRLGKERAKGRQMRLET